MKVFSAIKLGVPSVSLTLIYILSEDVCMCSRPGVHRCSAAALHQVLSSPPPHPCQASPSHSHFHTLLDFPSQETSARTLITVEKKVCFGSQYQRIQSVVIWLMVGGSRVGKRGKQRTEVPV